VVPLFFTRAAEKLTIPPQFVQVVKQITGASCCIGCRHSHVLVPPKAEESVIKEWRLADGRTESKAG
jgi:hypothetical protein